MKTFLLCCLLASQSLFASPTRKNIPQEDCWNLQALYATPDHWQQELDSFVPTKAPPYFPKLTLHKGALAHSPQAIFETLTMHNQAARKLEKLYIYAMLKHYEDMAEPQNKTLLGKIERTLQLFNQETSWIQPELLSLPEATFQQYIADDTLAEFTLYLERLYKQKPHVRTSSEEELIAQAAHVFEATSNAFGALNNADFTFAAVKDSEGNLHDLTLSTYSNLQYSNDRVLRKNAFLALSAKYIEHENSITELFAGTIKKHHFMAQTHRYSSCLEAALSPNDIEVDVYHNLIEAVRSRVALLHRYLKLKKECTMLNELHGYDLAVPLIPPTTNSYSLAEAKALALEAVEPLGLEYQTTLRNGLIHERWLDAYENQNKRSGAYSSGCFDTMPYMSLNFSGNLRDVFTLVHEAGHSMHTYYSTKSQPYQYANYSIFVAEVASLFNESLLRHMLLKRAKDKKSRAHLLNQALEDIRGTIFRQTMLAEFELFAHTCVEQNIPLTPKLLKDKFLELVQFYSGPDLALDGELAIGWAFIPHFYNNFYVYQYATGMAAALSLADSVLKGDEAATSRYIDFLRGGSSHYPLDLLAKAGCDMRTTAPVHKALDTFDAYLTELEQLVHNQ